MTNARSKPYKGIIKQIIIKVVTFSWFLCYFFSAWLFWGYMANRFWPFGKSENTANVNSKAQDIALTVALGSESLTGEYTDTTQDSSLNYYADVIAQNPIVYACIREVATSVSSIDFNAVVATSSGEYEDFNGPLGQLLRQPNPDWTTVDLIENITEQLLIYGNAYLYFQRAGVGGSNARINEIHLLMPSNVTIKTGSGPNSINGVEYYKLDRGGKDVHLSPSDVAHIKLPNQSTGAKTGLLYGVSPLAVLKNDAILDAMLSDLSANFIKRGAVPSGLLKLNRRVSSQEDADEVRNRWRSTFSGKRGQFNVAILDSDSAYEPLQALPKDLALEPTRNEVVARICGALGVPPIIVGTNLGLMRSTYSNYKQAQQSYIDETITPLANRLERFLNLKLVPNFSGNAIVKIDTSNSPAYIEAENDKVKRIKALFDSGIISLNEARQDLNYDPIDAGDIRRTPSNIFEVRVGDSVPVLSSPDPSKWLGSNALKALEPSPEAQHPQLEVHRTGPVPIPRANELIKEVRKNDQERVEKLAKDLDRKYFRPLKNRVDGVLGRRLNDEAPEKTKSYPFTVEDLAPPEMGDELSAMLQVTALVTLKATYDNLRNSGIVPTMELDERNKYAQRAIQQAGANGLRIHHTTQKNVRQVLRYGLEHGLTVREIADGGVLADGTPFKGLRGMLQDATKNRAPMIARTEISQMSNLSTLSYYNQMGADFVQLIDGDMFDETCASRNNTILEMEDASTLELAHPNCILDFVPALERGENPDAMVARMNEPIKIQKGKNNVSA